MTGIAEWVDRKNLKGLTLKELREERKRTRKRLLDVEQKLHNLRERFPGDQKKREKRETKQKVRALADYLQDITDEIDRREDRPPSTKKVYTRADWGAAPPRRAPSAMSNASDGLFVHHTVADSPTSLEAEKAEMRDLQAIAFGRGFADISYSFVISRSGRIFTGRGKGVEGAHTLGFNDTAYGVASMGNFNVSAPTDAQVDAYRYLRTFLHIESRPVRGHRDVGGTECPGDKLYAKIPDIRR